MNNVFLEISALLVIATIVSLLMWILKQPLIIGYIFTGLLVGPVILNLIKSSGTIEVFSTLGIALLLFIIGLGLNPKVIKEVGRVALVVGVVQVLLTGFFGWTAGNILGLTSSEAIVLAVALSFSSTIIIVKLLSDQKEANRLHGKITIGILLMQDIAAMIVLLVLTANNGTSLSKNQLIWLIGKGLFVSIPLLFIGNMVLPKMNKLVAGSQEFLFLFALGWGLGWAALFLKAGFSIEVGALLAGVSLASLPYAQEVNSKLRPLRDFFIIVFFIELGTKLNFDNFISILPTLIFCIFIVILVKPVIVFVTLNKLKYTNKTSFKTALNMSQISEFSLVIGSIALNKNIVSTQFVSLLTILALVTIAASAYLIHYSDYAFTKIEKFINNLDNKNIQTSDKNIHNELVLFGYKKGGHEFVNVFKSLKKSFCVVDYDPEVIDSLENNHVNYTYGDATDIELLHELNLEKSKLIVSTVTDLLTNKFILNFANNINSQAVVIVHAENATEASELYELGASYVMIPHYIGSEKIGAFIKKSGYKKSEFKKYKTQHLAYLQNHYAFNDNL